ncbi:brachyurin-like [Episyrphus balteatus]|uniref:brachyurin-like n=1 Tax=Episyrphus balteatus TaxID=286459 RepID=UPI0024859680|nr:brachyurin-like [Episyrphus balteatus]
MKILSIFLLFSVAFVASENQHKNQTLLHPRHIQPNITLIHRGRSFLGSRIVGGQNALKNQFPYQVGLQIYLSDDDSSFCGGTLISKRSVLTAAHCCEGAAKITVVLGAIQIYNQTEPNRKVMTVSGRSIKVHENWQSDELVNDVCLLKLPEEVELSESIAIADLPRDDSRDFFNENVIASGWGLASDDSNTISPVLKYAKMNVIRNFICNLYFFGSIKDTNICTSGKNGISTCNGDSGGPIVLDKSPEKNTTVIGITSFGAALGCEKGWPSVYTRVTKYLGWIKKNMV